MGSHVLLRQHLQEVRLAQPMQPREHVGSREIADVGPGEGDGVDNEVLRRPDRDPLAGQVDVVVVIGDFGGLAPDRVEAADLRLDLSPGLHRRVQLLHRQLERLIASADAGVVPAADE